jgi:hypothetical protein
MSAFGGKTGIPISWCDGICSRIKADSFLHPTPREHVIPVQHEEQGMKDMEQHFLKLRADAEECLNVSKRATDPQKRDLFARLAEHLNVLASEVARAISVNRADGAP